MGAFRAHGISTVLATRHFNSNSVPGDYDGDSKTDQAVFRPSNGYWLIRPSSTNVTSQIRLGLSGDTPAPGDYDNDGKNDLAVYHGGEWTIKRSSDNQILTPSFGQPNAQPVEAAYAPALTVPGLSINNVTITEGDAGAINAGFTVSLATASTQTVSVHYATANGTATAPVDYTAKSGTLTFTPGQTTKIITVQIKGDTTHEANETFKVNLSAPVNATISDGLGLGTILNND